MPFVKRNSKLENEILKEDLKDPKLKAEYEQWEQELQLRMALAKARKKANLSQTELAEKTGLSQQAISRIETGYTNATLGSLIKYISALGVQLTVVNRND